MSSWKDVYRAALVTVGKDAEKEPSRKWKKRILLSEHSPIRLLSFSYTFESIKYWIVMHLVRHKFGIEHFVRSQRDDITGVDRDDVGQGESVRYRVDCNAQALINISRKRLCRDAHKETRQKWKELLDAIDDDAVRSVCVPECVYRGFCPSMKPCGYDKTGGYTKRLEEYRKHAKSLCNRLQGKK